MQIGMKKNSSIKIIKKSADKWHGDFFHQKVQCQNGLVGYVWL
jgi:hypothetical protein